MREAGAAGKRAGAGLSQTPQDTHLPTSPGSVCKDTSFRARWARLRSWVKPSGSLCQRKGEASGSRPGLQDLPHPTTTPTVATTHLDKGFPLKSAISRALQNLMLSGISGMSVTRGGHYGERPVASRSSKSFLPPQAPPQTRPGLHTVPGHVQLHQLHEVSHLGGQPLDLVVTQAQFAQVQQPKEGLWAGVGSWGQACSRGPARIDPSSQVMGPLSPSAPDHRGTQGPATSPLCCKKSQEGTMCTHPSLHRNP